MDTDATRRRPFGGSEERRRESDAIEVSIPVETDGTQRVEPAPIDRREPTALWVYRLQVAALRARIDELERELEDRRRRERAIVDRYERLLAERTGTADEERTRDDRGWTGVSGVLSRLLDQLDDRPRT